MANNKEILEESEWLFLNLIEQKETAKWVDNILGECAELMLTPPYTIDNSFKYRNDAERYYRRLKDKEIKGRLVAQVRRHDKRSKASITGSEWGKAIQHFNNQCAYCGVKTQLTMDHFIPLSKGGELTLDNTIPCCKKCNSSKNNQEFNTWYFKQTFFSNERAAAIYDYLAQ